MPGDKYPPNVVVGPKAADGGAAAAEQEICSAKCDRVKMARIRSRVSTSLGNTLGVVVLGIANCSMAVANEAIPFYYTL